MDNKKHLDWIPPDLPLDKPSPSRIYDCLLGGFHNLEIDRVVVEKLLENVPDLRLMALANRAFLRRVVRYLLSEGIDQFLDVGSGIPTAGNVHELVHAANPEAHVVYVDIDPVAVAHSNAILLDNPKATAMRADACDIEDLIQMPEVRRLIDFNRPLAVLFLSLLHYIVEDEKAYHITRVVTQNVCAGSFIAISHPARDAVRQEIDESRDTFRKASNTKNRTIEEITRFFNGFEIVEPGLVYIPNWHPEGPDDLYLDNPRLAYSMGGVGIRRP